MTIFHFKVVRMQNYTKLCFNIWNLDELKVSWDDNTYKLKSYPHGRKTPYDIK